MGKCKACEKETKRMFPGGLCQGCYNYFRKGGTQNTPPPKGVIARDSRGYVICHICGRAYKRLGSHLKESHDMTIAEYKYTFGLCVSAKTTHEEYSAHMKSLALKHNMDKRLTQAGYKTRLKPGDKLRLGIPVRLQEILNKSKHRN